MKESNESKQGKEAIKVKEVYVLRHSIWDHHTDRLTEEGKQNCRKLGPALPSFKFIIASKCIRSQETAFYLTGSAPKIDPRVSSFEPDPKELNQIRAAQSGRSLSYGMAIFSIPSMIPKVREEGEELVSLIKETLHNLGNGQKALIISHQDAISASQKLLAGSDFSDPAKDYHELEGFIVKEDLKPRDFQP